MLILENGTWIKRNMTPAELAAMQAEQARLEAEEKHRPLTIGEVQELLVRRQINTLTVDDQTAYRMREFYPEWATDETYPVGYKLLYGGELYKVIQAHTSQSTWTPDISPSLYTRIDEQHDGTRYDPIPYNGNMALENGKYYSQGGATYKCTRDTGTAVFNPLSELVGIYVEAVKDGD